MLVLLVDDHPLFRQAVKGVIESHFPSAMVWDASTGEDAVRIVLAEPVELMILELRLPDISGVTVLKRMKQLRPSLKCLVLTMRNMRASRWPTGLPVISPKQRPRGNCPMPYAPFCPDAR
ncbi:MAG: response regulator transcription factor [Nitrospira sp. LK70]|nr:response regulator transcription factor [Nitrospira sp. LK70]